jgi:hypothetical protein
MIITAHENTSAWRLAFEDGFSRSDIEERWDINGAEKWEIADGMLRMSGGKPMWAVIKKPFWGDIRLSFECRQESDIINDVSAAISGYQFKYGGWFNTRSAIIAPDQTVIWEKEHSPLKRCVSYKAMFEKCGKALRMSVNGEEICVMEDPEMGWRATTHMHARAPDEVALFGWEADTWYSRIKVEMCAIPLKADLLEVAERFLQAGRWVTARDIFGEVAISTDDKLRIGRAVYGLKRAEECIRNRRYFLEARDNADEVRNKMTKIFPANPPPVSVKTYGLEVELSGRKIGVMPSFEGIPVRSIHCNRCWLNSIDNLAGMRLSIFHAEHNRLSDIRVLGKMPINQLVLGFNKITSLEGIEGLPLAGLGLRHNQISKIDVLKGMPIRGVQLDGNMIGDISPLKDSPLEELRLKHNHLVSIEPLSGMNLRVFHADNCGLSDVSVLKGMPLNDLSVADNRISDIPLNPDKQLSLLECQGNQLENFENLNTRSMICANISRNPVKSLSPFMDNPPLIFTFDCDSISDAELERAAFKWSAAPLKSNASYAAFSANVLLAVRRGDCKKLRLLGKIFGGHTYLYIPKDSTWAEARDLCEKFDGHLVTITSQEELEFICSTVLWDPFGYVCPWIGLEVESSGHKWITGENYSIHSQYYNLGWSAGEKARLLPGATRQWFTDVQPAFCPDGPYKWHAPFVIEWEY